MKTESESLKSLLFTGNFPLWFDCKYFNTARVNIYSANVLNRCLFSTSLSPHDFFSLFPGSFRTHLFPL